MPKLQRSHWIFLCLLLILSGEVAHYVWTHWGLITVHSKGQALSQVIRSIEKQGHVTIKTNMDGTKPVNMDVDHVALAEALETLAVNTEARCRLTYFVGPDKSSIDAALADLISGRRPEGWLYYHITVPTIGEQPVVLPDPRDDLWVVKEAKEATLQGYLKEAAKNVSASFHVLESFNPPIKSLPKSGAITSSLPKLASAAKGKYEEVFLLQGDSRPDRADSDRRDRSDDGGPMFAGNFGDVSRGRSPFDRSSFEERIQNEINKLPAAERVTAQQEHDDWKRFFDSLKDLSPEEKSRLFQARMSDPANQEKMDAAKNASDSRRSPQARMNRAQSYMQRMAAAKGVK